MTKVLRALSAVFVMCVMTAAFSSRPACAATLPAGFSETQVSGPWNEIAGIAFAEDGRMLVWERSGRVFLQHNGQWHVAIDIREEVGAWRDFGLLGVALHPNFLNNGQIFLLYVVDRHHLLNFGTPNYNPNSNHYFAATIGRITRYTLDARANFLSIVPDSRVVLVGETISTGFPILHESHGVGSLVFGSDGTLLASCGDGASYNAVDAGSSSGGSYANQAVADGIIKVKENVGAFRSQLVDCLNGKVIRIDPNTGDGVATNPFFVPAQPRASRSRVWALGLRNPFRMTLRPGTGSHFAADADPGVLCIGDVGWNAWEELNICTGPPGMGGQNFGWPVYEGMNTQAGYFAVNAVNQDAPNPLFGIGGCTQKWFLFRELIVQDTLVPDPAFPNSCNTSLNVPSSIPTFIHRRPEIDWGRPNGPARVGTYNGTTATVINVGASGSPVSGSQFGGNCSIGGAWYTGTSYPMQYRNTYFHADFGTRWIRSIVFNSSNKATAVQSFASNTGDIVAMAAHPITGDLYYSNWTALYKISYNAGPQPPVAMATANVAYGPSPHTVQFSSAQSSDPANQQLQYLWDFGDGETSTDANPLHVYKAPAGVPTQFNALLTVTNASMLSSNASVVISVNNTPPTAMIISPVTGSTIATPGTGNLSYYLSAQMSDLEHAADQLQCSWQVVLHHNNHTHPEPAVGECLTTAVLSPAGCDGNVYFYRVHFSVTDAAGLSASEHVDIYPECSGNVPPVAGNDATAITQGSKVVINVLANDSDSDGTLNPATVAIVQPPVSGSALVDPVSGLITYSHSGTSAKGDSFGYTVNDNLGGTSNLAIASIAISAATPGDLNDDGIVNVDDLVLMLGNWGPCTLEPCLGDLNSDLNVNVDDLVLLLASWTSSSGKGG